MQAVAVDLGRACDTTDWLCNTLGAGLGVALGCGVLLLHRRWPQVLRGHDRLTSVGGRNQS